MKEFIHSLRVLWFFWNNRYLLKNAGKHLTRRQLAEWFSADEINLIRAIDNWSEFYQ
jgi:hypothetical protein